MLKIKDLKCSKGNFNLDINELELNSEDYFVLMGPSASGKSVFGKCICGIEQNYIGQIEIFGKKMEKVPLQMRKVFMMGQSCHLFPHMNVKENLEFSLDCRNLKKESGLIDICNEFGITHLLDRKISTLSGGESKRAELARAVLSRPEILILDEPLNGLDSDSKHLFMDKLKNAIGAVVPIVIHITHDWEEASYFSKNMGIILNGKLSCVGTLEEICETPKTKEILKFLGENAVFYFEKSDSDIVFPEYNSFVWKSNTDKFPNKGFVWFPEDRIKLFSEEKNNTIKGEIIEVIYRKRKKVYKVCSDIPVTVYADDNNRHLNTGDVCFVELPYKEARVYNEDGFLYDQYIS